MISNRGFNFFAALCLTLLSSGYSTAAPLNLANQPLFLGSSAPPLLMLTVGKDHKLYYEAYNDASDLNNDGVLDVGYTPDIDYYGYFNSYACYDYNSSDGRFVPQSVKSEADKSAGIKTCNAGSGSSSEYSGDWSGDFLNYVTMARIDALRKVFYGGHRVVDTADLTVIERTHIPQDAHTWAKEYRGYDKEGYYIDEITPLDQPPMGRGHLFGNVSYSVGADPLLRVLPNTIFRPWEWASIERPVLDDKCVPGIGASKVDCEVSGSGDSWSVAEPEFFDNLRLNFYRDTEERGAPDNESEFNSMVSDFATDSNRIGSEKSISQIEENDIVADHFPGGESGEYFLSVVTGDLSVPATGNYTFSVNGDDAVEFIIRTPGGTEVDDRVTWHGGHSADSSDTELEKHEEEFYLEAGVVYDIEFRHYEEIDGESFELYRGQSVSSSQFAEYAVRAEVCKSAGLLEDNCKTYSDGTDTSYKPTGLLHDYGENESILFGLLTGSFENNLDGGVLRKVVSSFRDEVNSDDGTFTDVNGIVSTLDKLRTVNFRTSDYSYECGRTTTRPIVNGECDMWGNPIAEMMYETVRYFSGKGAPTTDFDIADSGNNDAALGLPNPDWNDPYDETTGGQPYCAAPYMMVVSDVNVSYDSDKVPGSSFSAFAGDVTGLDVTALSSTITGEEPDVPGLHYIGESGSVADNAPTAKMVTSLANIRGLAPEEPTKLGSYYSAAIGYHGWLTDLFPDKGSESNPTNINTFAVALASPLPRINISLSGGDSISLVPFAKSPGGSSINKDEGEFQPTNTIVDFYVESITPKSGSFLINFEDVEQGADHDMDAIARYRYEVNDSETEVTVTVDSLYAAGGIDQHMGYVISGTSKDGIYLVVHDRDGGVPTYYLDTPAGVDPGDPRGTDKLTLTSTRTFTPSGDTAATLLKDPLYFAAKWGGFIDKNDNDIPDLTDEWDTKNNITQETGPDGVPDNYFQVTNALGLKDQLSSAFNTILAREASSSTVTVNSGALNTDTLLFQAVFNAEDWSGNVFAYPVEGGGLGTAVWNFRDTLDDQLSASDGFLDNREVVTYNQDEGAGVPFRWPSDTSLLGLLGLPDDIGLAQVNALRGGVTDDTDEYGEALLNFIRGDQSEEGAASTWNFRERTTVLGDIVNSDPLFVPQPGFFYPDNWGASAAETSEPYSDFRNKFKDRDPVLYFGANDGLFHAINAYADNSDSEAGPIRTDGGKELLAYVPSLVTGDLNKLSDPNYNHQYYVDGPSTYGDVFFDSKWHTTLVGALGKGGQGLFALDITDPKGTEIGYPSFNEADASDLVLWEFSDANDADMGYSYGDPVIVRMNNGEWAAIFANGYNNTDSDGSVSSTGNAVLYIVNIETGALIRKLDTGEGLEDDPQSPSRPNGLASPAVIDEDGDYIADAIYAGDLFGNLWKFDVSGTDKTSWGVAFGTTADPEPLFVAKDSDGNELPITSRPTVGSHPDPSIAPGEVIVYFGTGKYLESGDNDPSDQNTQGFFAIWDDGTQVSGRSDLLQQSIIGETTSGDFDFRLTTDNEIRWEAEDHDSDPLTADLPARRGWYMDLVNTEGGSTDNQGERIIFEPIIRNDRIIFTTLIPSLDQCAAGGSGWLMEVSAISGARLPESPFDVNDDGVFNDADLVDFDGDFLPTSGIRKAGGAEGGSGIPTPPAILDELECPDGVCSERKFTGTSKATIESIRESSGPSSQGRQNWREVN